MAQLVYEMRDSPRAAGENSPLIEVEAFPRRFRLG